MTFQIECVYQVASRFTVKYQDEKIYFVLRKTKNPGNIPINEKKVGMRHFISNTDAKDNGRALSNSEELFCT